MLVRDHSMRNKWPMVRVITTYADKKGIVRSLQLQLGKEENLLLEENEKC